MSNCKTHKDHKHEHGENCGHNKIKHGDHYDYLHGGHMHHPHNDHVDEHKIEVSAKNPDDCNKKHECGDHVHGKDCGHQAVPHGDHVDYVVKGRLHHQHDGHCDDHGEVEVKENK